MTKTIAAFSLALLPLACAAGVHSSAAAAPHMQQAHPLNLSLPVLPEEEGLGGKAVQTERKRETLEAERIPLGYEANPVCRNGVRATAYRIINGRTYYKCD